MNTRHFLLPSLCLGGAVALLVPARTGQAFSKIGGSLGETQRDVRVFDNFLDATANNNATPTAQFPGYTGAELAVWKGVVEWGAKLHGDGSGDPVSGNLLGDGGANFDAFWSGNANAVGTTNNNIVSSLADCGGGGTLAFTETPISDGWRIRFCDEWTWDDGPGTIQNRFDIQGVMCHEYGHALGLGHSTVNAATMFPSVGAGATGIRSIAADDGNGAKCVYGTASATKPMITATVANAGTMTIYGMNFDAGATNEIWFTPSAVTASGNDPIVRVANVASTSGGTVITLAIPGAAGPGDVMVNKSGTGGATLSNAFPTDLVGTFGTPPVSGPVITSVSPSNIDALIPGTAKTVTITGTDLDLTTGLLLDGNTIPSGRYTIVNPTTIQLDMPQANTLGTINLSATDGVSTSNFPVTIVVPATPKYELGNGEPLNVVDRDDGLPFILSGVPGSTHRVLASTSNLPSNSVFVNLDLGNNFTDITIGGNFVIPASGWLMITVPPSSLGDPGPGGMVFYSQNIDLTLPFPFAVSNLQSMTLVQ